MNQNHKDRISIQVGLNGYSFRLENDGQKSFSGWLSADRVFSTPEFQRGYDEVQVALFTPKTTLVPEQFHSREDMRQVLGGVVALGDSDVVDSVAVPEFGAVLIYSNTIGESLSKVVADTVRHNDGSAAIPLPEHYFMLRALSEISEYNKIIASYMDGRLYLVIAQGNSLMLCNSFEAQDFTTAQYFIFLAMKKFQLNPEVSTIRFRTPLEPEQEMSLYHYFRSVEHI